MSAAKRRRKERISRSQVDKFAERQAELAEAALQTLAELGYARTSLREIAQNSDFSHGVLHYYFADKAELLMYCVRQYKARCVTRYDEIAATAATADELMRGFGAGMAETLRAEATMHRLWYDLRTQSLFEASFRGDVADIDRSLERMVWRIVEKYAQLSSRELALTSPLAYALFDGIFQQALLKHLAGDKTALRTLDAQVQSVLHDLAVKRVPARQTRIIRRHIRS